MDWYSILCREATHAENTYRNTWSNKTLESHIENWNSVARRGVSEEETWQMKAGAKDKLSLYTIYIFNYELCEYISNQKCMEIISH